MNELKFNASEVKILKLLYEDFEKGITDNYVYKISKRIGRSIPATLDNLRNLENIGLIISHRNPDITLDNLDRRQPSKFYNLTDEGQAFGWAFLYTENFVNFYKKVVRR